MVEQTQTVDITPVNIKVVDAPVINKPTAEHPQPSPFERLEQQAATSTSTLLNLKNRT